MLLPWPENAPPTPVPDTLIEAGELLALLVTVTVPVKFPAVLGANSIWRIAVCPAAMVVPLTPLSTLKPVPLADASDTVTLEFPALTRVAPSVLDPPTASLPKFKTEFEISNVRVGVPPVPLTAILTSAAPLLPFSITDPVTLPEAVGKNPTVKDFVAPDATVSGVDRPLTLIPLPATEVLLMTTL